MKRENNIFIRPPGIRDKFNLKTGNLNKHFRMIKTIWLLVIIPLLHSYSAEAQCKLKEIKIPGTDLIMISSNGISLDGEWKNLTCKFIKIDTSYFVSINKIKRATDNKIFSIDGDCPFVFLLDSKQKIILYPVNQLNVDKRISNYLFDKQGLHMMYFAITHFQVEQVTASFYSQVQLYFKSDKSPEHSASNTWGTYFSFPG
jgi:hypothetical protein